MGGAARRAAIKTWEGRFPREIVAAYGLTYDEVRGYAERHGITFGTAPFATIPPLEKIENTDEGQPGPPERPACEGTPTPAAAEHAPGDGGPDGGSSTVAGATSDGGGEGATSAADAAAAAPAMARTSPPPQTKRPKVMAKAGELKPEPKGEMSADEFAVTIYLPRSVLRTLQERAEKPRWTRAQMAAAMVIQACNKE